MSADAFNQEEQYLCYSCYNKYGVCLGSCYACVDSKVHNATLCWMLSFKQTEVESHGSGSPAPATAYHSCLTILEVQNILKWAAKWP